MEKKRLGMGVTVVALCGVLAGGMALAGCTGTAPVGDASEKTPATGAATEAHQVDDEAVALTPKEFQIIAFLANHPAEVFSAQEIMANVWGEAYQPDSASIAVFVRKIRAKIEDDPASPSLILTRRGVGYYFAGQ